MARETRIAVVCQRPFQHRLVECLHGPRDRARAAHALGVILRAAPGHIPLDGVLLRGVHGKAIAVAVRPGVDVRLPGVTVGVEPDHVIDAEGMLHRAVDGSARRFTVIVLGVPHAEREDVPGLDLTPDQRGVVARLRAIEAERDRSALRNDVLGSRAGVPLVGREPRVDSCRRLVEEVTPRVRFVVPGVPDLGHHPVEVDVRGGVTVRFAQTGPQ